jgi:molybdenum cofactor cytidylyltransferase
MSRIVGVLLAAGSGSRFGGDKLVVPLAQDVPPDVAPGTPLAVAAALHLVAALPDSVAVVRPRDAALATRLRAVGLQVVHCARADEGMGASLACGVAAARDADGWIIALADMPWIAPATIRAIADALRSGDDIAAPSFRGERGHPVGIGRRHYAALAALGGDRGARAVIERERDRLTLVDVSDAGVVRDVDFPGDLEERESSRKRSV